MEDVVTSEMETISKAVSVVRELAGMQATAEGVDDELATTMGTVVRREPRLRASTS